MRRLVIFVLATSFLLAVVGPVSSAPRARVVTKAYDLPSGLRYDTTFVLWSLPVATTGAAFRALPGERSVSIEISDQFGGSAIGHFHIDRDGDGHPEVDKEFCRSTDGTFAITGRSRIEVFPLMGVCEDGTPALATRGVVEVTFQK